MVAEHRGPSSFCLSEGILRSSTKETPMSFKSSDS